MSLKVFVQNVKEDLEVVVKGITGIKMSVN